MERIPAVIPHERHRVHPRARHAITQARLLRQPPAVDGAREVERGAVVGDVELVHDPALADVGVVRRRRRRCELVRRRVAGVRQREAVLLQRHVPALGQGAAHRLEALLDNEGELGQRRLDPVRHGRLVRVLRFAYGDIDVVAVGVLGRRLDVGDVGLGIVRLSDENVLANACVGSSVGTAGI